MKRLLMVAACLFIVAPSQAQRWGEYRFAHETVKIRAERTTNSEAVGTLSRGGRVLVHFCEDNPGESAGPNDGVWCAIFFTYQENGDPDTATPRGYVYEPLLKKVAPPRPKATPRSRPCCKICRKGKACGDSCIARNKTCRKGPGCACNG